MIILVLWHGSSWHVTSSRNCVGRSCLIMYKVQISYRRIFTCLEQLKMIYVHQQWGSHGSAAKMETIILKIIPKILWECNKPFNSYNHLSLCLKNKPRIWEVGNIWWLNPVSFETIENINSYSSEIPSSKMTLVLQIIETRNSQSFPGLNSRNKNLKSTFLFVPLCYRYFTFKVFRWLLEYWQFL